MGRGRAPLHTLTLVAAEAAGLVALVAAVAGYDGVALAAFVAGLALAAVTLALWLARSFRPLKGDEITADRAEGFPGFGRGSLSETAGAAPQGNA